MKQFIDDDVPPCIPPLLVQTWCKSQFDSADIVSCGSLDYPQLMTFFNKVIRVPSQDVQALVTLVHLYDGQAEGQVSRIGCYCYCAVNGCCVTHPSVSYLYLCAHVLHGRTTATLSWRFLRGKHQDNARLALTYRIVSFA